jgi:hypothetical protein
MNNTSLTLWLSRVAFVVFTVWTAQIVLEHGYTGFITLSLEEDWAAQMFVDLVIALVIALGWLIGDARRRGRAAWPFVVMTLFLGSIGPLLYLSLRSEPAGDADAS